MVRTATMLLSISGNGIGAETRFSIHLRATRSKQCEATFRKCDWDRFGYWHAIYLRERPRSLASHVKLNTGQDR
jgi:hypothetical protein